MSWLIDTNRGLMYNVQKYIVMKTVVQNPNFIVYEVVAKLTSSMSDVIGILELGFQSHFPVCTRWLGKMSTGPLFPRYACQILYFENSEGEGVKNSCNYGILRTNWVVQFDQNFWRQGGGGGD